GWDPIGMRATASHVVRFDDTFIPDAQQIGPPGVYLTGDVQAMFAPHYAASFLGAAEAVSVFAVEHVQAHHKENDPYVQHRVGAMAEHLALAAVDHCVRVCGARCLIRPSPVERILRDLSFYVRHDNADHILAAIGRAELGLPYDGSFAKP